MGVPTKMKCDLSNNRLDMGLVSFGTCLSLACVLFLVSCTTSGTDALRASDEERHAPLIVARTGDTALLSWQSRVGELYTVLYADGQRVGVDWRPLESAQRIHGTGGEIRLEDRMRPGLIRYYRLMVTPGASDRSRALRR